MDASRYQELCLWMRLQSTPGVGNLLFKQLIDRFRHPKNLYNPPYDDVLSKTDIKPGLIRKIRRHDLPDSAKRDLDLCIEKGYGIVTFHDPEYPPLLRHIPDPPPFLYVWGTLPVSVNYLAVVGTRDATGYGRSAARKIVGELVRSGLMIVSGMAKGIDAVAHEAALDAGGKTVAVLGGGLEKIYPAVNIPLANRIREKTAVITEFSPNTGPRPYHFPMRNRIISGMALGTVVVEAGEKSGALITARLAAEQNREVFAVPGNIQSAKTKGTHTLINQGAKLITRAEDVIEEIQAQLVVPENQSQLKHSSNQTLDIPKKTVTFPGDLTKEAYAVMQALSEEPIHLDPLSRTIGLQAGKLAALLLRMEIEGLIRQLPGNKYIRAIPSEETRL